ncbi:MAG: envelope stress response rane protein PspC [Pseudomonadota bacterium]|jgi:phage shock protein C
MEPRRTKFYLDKQNGKWSGVCAGIADFTGLDVLWIRIGVVALTAATFPTGLFAYWFIAWIASPKPSNLYENADEAKFWQGVRRSPTRSTRDVRSKFRDIDRRLADVETFYTSRNSSLASEIDNLR